MEFEGKDKCLRDIFGPLLVGDIDVKAEYALDKKQSFKDCLPKFKVWFSSNIFENEYAFFYELITAVKISVYNTEQMQTIIDQNKDVILTSPTIDIDTIVYGYKETKLDGITDEIKIAIFKRIVAERMGELRQVSCSKEEFESACRLYINEYVRQSEMDIPHKMARIMSDEGLVVQYTSKRKKLYKGYEDATEYFRKQDKIIKDIRSMGARQSKVIGRDWLDDKLSHTDKDDGMATIRTGIAEIDEVVGHIRRSNMIGILGPPKGGKTRFTTYLVCKFLKEGYNVAVWPLEGTQEEWTACITANIVRTDSNLRVKSKEILENTYKQEFRQSVLAAETKLAVDETRGRLSFIDETANVETFIDTIKNHYESENPFDVIVIDSPVLILSKNGMPKAERLSTAYEQLKVLISTGLSKKVVGIFPAQLKQDVVDFLRTHPEETMDVTAGGETAATVRSPDYVWGLFSSKAERDADMLKLYDVASRHNANFSDTYVHAEYDCCYFNSDADLNNGYNA